MPFFFFRFFVRLKKKTNIFSPPSFLPLFHSPLPSFLLFYLKFLRNLYISQHKKKTMFSSLYSMWTSALSYLGLADKKGKILLLGLDAAGKTTLLGLLSKDELRSYKPTNHPNKGVVQMGSLRLNVIDLGGHREAERLWKMYFTCVDGIVFVVDSADTGRFERVRATLGKVLEDEELSKVPLVVFGNKTDAPGAVSEEALCEALHITGLSTGDKSQKQITGRPFRVFMGSLRLRCGYGSALRWLSQHLESA